MNVTVIGLLFDIAGALLLGYEIFVYRWKLWEAYLYENRSATARRTYEGAIDEVRHHSSIESQEYDEELIRYFQKRLKESIERHKNDMTPFESRKAMFGLIGIVFLIAGFILQVLGASQ